MPSAHLRLSPFDLLLYLAYMAQGLALTQQERYEEAAACFDRSTQANPTLSSGRFMAASAHALAGRLETALSIAEQGLEMEPGFRLRLFFESETRSGMPAATQPNVVDRNFARAAAAGGLAEVELGRLADQKGKSSEARQFGQHMIDDHSKANSQLKEIAAAANIPLPDASATRRSSTAHPAPTRSHVRRVAQSPQGGVFDRDYIRAQITAHQDEQHVKAGQQSHKNN
jgi:predicted outer membrane protein